MIVEETAIEPPFAAEEQIETLVTAEPVPAVAIVDHAPVIAEEVFEQEEPILVEERPTGPIRSGLYWIGDTIGSFFSGLFGN